MNEKSLLQDRNLYLIFGITLFAVMGVASITPALPKVIKFFDLQPEQVGWLITVFTFPGIFLTPVLGVIGDRMGRKKILVPSLFLFGIAGFLCFFTQNFMLLLIFRFVQGIGAAPLGSLNVTLIGDLYEGNQRAAAMGYNASVLSLGTATYPAVGGLFAAIGWNYPFILPLLAIPLGIIILRYLKNPEPVGNQKLGQYIKNTWQNINQKRVWALFTVNVLTFVILYGALLTYFPVMMEQRFQAGSVVIGFTMTLMSLTTAVVSANLSGLLKIIRNRNLLLLSSVFYMVALFIFGWTNTWWLLIPAIIIYGLGHGSNIPNVQTMLVEMAPMKQRAGFMSLNSMVLRTGQTLGPLITGLFYSLGGLSWTFFGSMILSVMIFLISLLLLE
jgi:MFS family permease